MQPKRISILGVGLLGGSIGLAVKSRLTDCEIVGYGHRRVTLDKALEVGAIDRAAEQLSTAVDESDLVILCTPVGLFRPILQEIAGTLRPGTVVTDVGSTKRSVVRDAEQLLPSTVHFIGSHPMAGSEKRGVEYARTDLFQNALCITTPADRTNPGALETVEHLWRSIGMRITRVTPDDHDRLLAEVSHLPHAVAAALVAMQSEAGLKLSGKGFLDATRIAGGDGTLWRDIFLDNRDNLLASIARLKHELAQVEQMLKNNDTGALAEWLDAAAARREELVKQKLGELEA
jgi:prephenate dehydrogenase